VQQKAVCNIPCPQKWEPRASIGTTYGNAVVGSILLYCAFGLLVVVKVRGQVENFFLGGD
jgi:hypothetical protein